MCECVCGRMRAHEKTSGTRVQEAQERILWTTYVGSLL